MLTNESATPSLSDIAAVTGNNDFGGNSGWWILIILFAIFGGWGTGNYGYGNGRVADSSNSGAYDNYVLASDFATLQSQMESATASLERKGDTINAGLCDGFYAMNTGMLNGFAGVNSTVTQNGYDTRNAIQQAQINAMQNANAVQSQIDNGISGINYNMATTSSNLQQQLSNGFCQNNFNVQSNARDIVDNQNSNTQAILSAINQMNIDAKDSKIAELSSQVQALNLAASQQAQNAYLINQIRPAAIPAYTVANPYGGNYTYGCGCSAS